MSFGDDTLAKYLVLFLSQACPLQFRQTAFGSEDFVELCTVRASQVPLPAYLSPLETDRRQIDLYFRALQSERAAEGSLLYAVALHHVTAFLFCDFGGLSTVAEYAHDGDVEAPKHRQHLLRRLITATGDGLYFAVVTYHPTGCLAPEARLPQLVASAVDAAAMGVLRQRHPSLGP